jgi:hypothetical protein
MKLSLIAAAIILSITTTSCSAAQKWFDNPVDKVQVFEQAADVAVDGAKLAFAAILPNIPADKQAQAITQFNNALAAVTHAEQALLDAANAAAEAQQPKPDFSVVMKDVTDAVNQVLAIVDQYKSSGKGGKIGGGKSPRGLDDAKAAAGLMQRMSHK